MLPIRSGSEAAGVSAPSALKHLQCLAAPRLPPLRGATRRRERSAAAQSTTRAYGTTQLPALPAALQLRASAAFITGALALSL